MFRRQINEWYYNILIGVITVLQILMQIIFRVLTSPERWLVTLFSHLALISQMLSFLINQRKFHGIFWSDDLLILGCLPGLEQSCIRYFQILNTLKELNFPGCIPWTVPGSSQHHVDPTCVGNAFAALAKWWSLHISQFLL